MSTHTGGNLSGHNRNGFTRTMRGGSAAHNESVKNARTASKILKRQADSWALHIKGFRYDEIAKITHVTKPQAWRDVVAHWELKREMASRETDEVRDAIQAGLDHVKRHHWRKAGSASSAKVILDVLKAEEHLHGAAKPRPGVVSMDQVFAAARGTIRDLLAHFTDLGDRAAIGRAFARYFGPGATDQPPMIEAQRGETVVIDQEQD